MTVAQFYTFWNTAYPGAIPLQHHFRHMFADRWFRIHNLPFAKRYAYNEKEWSTLLGRQNTIISDLLDGHTNVILVTGVHTSGTELDMHLTDEAESINSFAFIALNPIDLHKINPTEYDKGQCYTPMFSEQVWKKGRFNHVLSAIAAGNLRAFFLSIEMQLIIAPYDGGVDLILKDVETMRFYKHKYQNWLSERQDGL